ncbi:CG13671 [Drosophila busckii]|uniref:CG13671 n=1 Tax=Drosophila busckii TaxID=30019 RepID=A0A0M4EDQ3_DROBS|nr:uncharacterized protein LOC108600860 [Drosophila busckii]ALC43771.1 CG13671 [Drosophila busckii]
MILFIYIWLNFAFGLLPYTQGNIIECPGRSVRQVRAEVDTSAEISLVFYYVSWSSEARQARLVYDGVAHYFKDYASFGAIDCWHLQCNCSHTHPQIPGIAANGGYPDLWPTLMVKYGQKVHLRLQYQGAWLFEDLTRFMNNLIQPIDRMHSAVELNKLWAAADAVVLGLFNSANEQVFKRFMATSVHWLEYDPDRNVRFAVAFGSTANQILKRKPKTLPQLVYIDNRHAVHIYNESRTWLPTEIMNWLQHRVNPLLTMGYGTPSKLTLKARHTPVLAMGIRMHHQHQTPSVMGVDLQRKEHADCDQQDTEHVKLSLLQMPKELYKAGLLPTNCASVWQLNAAVFINYYRINAYLNYLWSQQVHESQLATEADQLLTMHRRNRCLAQTHTKQGTPSSKIRIAKLISAYGQVMLRHSTEQNQTLAVALFDSFKYRDFLNQLGIDQHPHALHKRDSAGVHVFIVDVDSEAVYVMPQHPFSTLALKDFIKQYYAGQLSPVQKNALLPAIPATEGAFMSNYNRHLLLEALQHSNATNVVLIYRTDCPLSAVLSQVLMQVAALLRSPELNFIRFEARSNDLPWELTMDYTPNLFVFPQSSPTESVLFPIDIRVDMANVMSFILAQLEPELQLRLVLASCRRSLRHARSCLDFARGLVMQHIGQYLKYWETYVSERDSILKHLKQFNELHTAIESSFRS